MSGTEPGSGLDLPGDGMFPSLPEDAKDFEAWFRHFFMPNFAEVPTATLSELYEEIGGLLAKYEHVLPEGLRAVLAGYVKVADRDSGAAALRTDIEALHAEEEQ